MQYSQAEKNSSVLVALVNCIPAIITLFIAPYTNAIMEGVNSKIPELIPGVGLDMSIMWTIISVILVIVFCMMTIDTALRLRNWFNPEPKGAGQWVANIVSFGFMLVPLFTYSYYIYNLTKYFFKTL